MSQILSPPRIYLDTSQLINLARIRKGRTGKMVGDVVHAYSELNRLIFDRHVGLIFNAAAPLDWVDGKADDQSVREIARVLQSARLHYYFPGDQVPYLSEVLAECKRIAPEITIPEVPLLQQILPNKSIRVPFGYLVRNVPGFVDLEVVDGDPSRLKSMPDEILLPTFEQVAVESLKYRRRRPTTYQERVTGYDAALANDIKHVELIRKGRAELTVEWMKHFLRVDLVLRAFNPNLDVDSLLSSVETTRCPAVHLWSEARYKRILAGHSAHENDADDWLSLPLAIYSDLMLTERPLREFILQADRRLEAKVFASVLDACAALRQIVG